MERVRRFLKRALLQVVEHEDELHSRLREKKAEQSHLAESIRRIARRQELVGVASEPARARQDLAEVRPIPTQVREDGLARGL